MEKIIETMTEKSPGTPSFTTTRLGKKPETSSEKTHRPLLVKFDQETERNEFMKRLYKLKDSNYEKISVKADMTREEREAEKKLREEAKVKNGENKAPNIIYLIRKETWDRKIAKITKRVRTSNH